MEKYQNKRLSFKERAEALLSEMTIEEKVCQLSAEMLIMSDSKGMRDYRLGNARNPAHFIHWDFDKKVLAPKSTREVVECINEDIKRSMQANRFGIPVLLHEEALHGAQWGMGSCFPQPIALASSFDDLLVAEVADCIAKECRAVGVRQVLAPVVNVCRDSRWGRTMESFGEDVLLNANFGAAICKSFEQNGVIATPKHFVDNYADGGRDSNESHSSERMLREIYYKPFERCVKNGQAKSIMTSYNLIDGIPCACNRNLLEDVLRDEWGFDGFVVSDYDGINGVCGTFYMTDTECEAQAMAMNNGHDVTLPWHAYEKICRAIEEGYLSEQTLDKCVLRVLTQKFRLGLMDEPYVDAEKAEKLIRNESARALAYKAAQESMVLLKNNGSLPFSKNKVKKVGALGQSVNKVPIGENYSGPYGGWYAEDAKTPLQALQEYLNGVAEVVFYESAQAKAAAKECDVVLYFTSIIEGEGLDRCDLKLPKTMQKRQVDGAGFIVDKRALAVVEDQEEIIKILAANNNNTVVILLNGAPIDMTSWIENVAAVLEAWYPGEQGGRAIVELLFGEYAPSGKLPISFPRSVGQLPLCYSYRPSGRGYGYNENDGTPLYPFGYGLSYTTFELQDVALKTDGRTLSVVGCIKNTGNMKGAEVLQVYIHGRHCGICRPLKELKGYKRVEVDYAQIVRFEIALDEESFYFYDASMRYGIHDSDYTIMVGTSSKNILHQFDIQIRDEKIKII